MKLEALNQELILKVHLLFNFGILSLICKVLQDLNDRAYCYTLQDLFKFSASDLSFNFSVVRTACLNIVA